MIYDCIYSSTINYRFAPLHEAKAGLTITAVMVKHDIIMLVVVQCTYIPPIPPKGAVGSMFPKKASTPMLSLVETFVKGLIPYHTNHHCKLHSVNTFFNYNEIFLNAHNQTCAVRSTDQHVLHVSVLCSIIGRHSFFILRINHLEQLLHPTSFLSQCLPFTHYL